MSFLLVIVKKTFLGLLMLLTIVPLVLFGLAVEMIFGIEVFKSDDDELGNKSASIVPIAFPLIAGAGSMTTIVSLRAEFESINIVIAIIVNMIIVYLVLRSTTIIERLLGNTGIVVLKKVFGIILLAIAVKLFFFRPLTVLESRLI